jgi:peptidoglycan hydrolase-like protein with peptidoglycan-binding domain
MSRPTISRGDSGANVIELQDCLGVEADGDFGPATEQAVMTYQEKNDLEPDGVVGPQTWATLEAEFDLPPYPPPLPELDADMAAKICRLVEQSRIASYTWRDRGQAPIGYTQGMALTFALAVLMHEAADT